VEKRRCCNCGEDYEPQAITHRWLADGGLCPGCLNGDECRKCGKLLKQGKEAEHICDPELVGGV
jgi:hypothetical protein